MDLVRMREGLGLPPDASPQEILSEMARVGGQLLQPDGQPFPEPTPVVNSHTVQATVEGAELLDWQRVEFMGQTFKMADKIGLMPLIRFAATAKQGAGSDDMEGLAAMYTMIRDCIDPQDWPRFEQHAIDQKAEADELFELVGKVLETLAARPTQRPAVSSAGSPTTSQSSKATPSLPVTAPPGTTLDGMADIGDLLGR